MRKCYYTVIVDNYDTLKEPTYITPGWDYICISDTPEIVPQGSVWQFRPCSPGKKSSRHAKILFHEYLPEYDLLVYGDGCFQVTGNLDSFALSKQSGLHLLRHPTRSCAYVEGSIVKDKSIDSAETIDSQLKRYKNAGFPEHFGLWKGGLLVRFHNSQIVKLMQDWWQEVESGSYRDQISLPYVLWKNNFSPEEILPGIPNYYFKYHFHNLPTPSTTIHYITPYGYDKRLGEAINAECKLYADTDWICLRDADTMLFHNDYGDFLKRLIERYPDTALFTGVTNRSKLLYLCHEGKISEDPNILNHSKIADERRNQYDISCTDINQPVAGYFMLFPKYIWNRIGFQGQIVDNGVFFDWKFSKSILDMGGKIRRADGLYVYHFYRHNKSITDITHLT